MFPHVGHRNHRIFMETMHRALKPNGVFLMESTVNSATTTFGDPWIDRYIFPGLLMPSGKQIFTAIEGLFGAEDMHNFGPHYVQTLRDWNMNFDKSWIDFRGRHEERIRRMFEYFFLVSAALFRARTMEYWHLVMTRQGDPQPPCRVSCTGCRMQQPASVAAHSEMSRESRVESGSMDGRSYHSDYFNFTYSLPEGFTEGTERYRHRGLPWRCRST